MSSRKKKQNAALATGSARNLDGRRLRTIAEAKNLAAYLATKPEADARERDEKRKRWEQIVELAEQREADMRAGKGKDGRKRGLGEDWIESKEEVGENVKNAVKLAMERKDESESASSGRSGEASDTDSEGAKDDGDDDVMELDEEEIARLRVEAESGDVDAIWVLKNKLKIPSQYLPAPKPPARKFAGFDDDDDDDFTSSSDEDEDGMNSSLGKGKEKMSVPAS